MKPEDTEILTFKPEIEGDFIYIFNVVKTNDLSPKGYIIISFNQHDYMHITKYGIYTKKTKKNILHETKVLFKFRYIIDKTFC